VTAVLWLDLPLFVAFKRAYGRVSDSVTGDTFNIYYNADGIEDWEMQKHPDDAYPPHLHVTLKSGNPPKRRADDENAHAVVTRIDNYMAQTAPLLDYYRKQGLVLTVNADQSIEAVTADIKKAIDERQQA
jgi:adenylate kinase family enzyme